jgi:predicted AAA+ superfamily ATPase
VKPYTRNLSRSIQKPPKIYFYDNGDVQGDEGARFENLVAAHLIKKLNFLEDRDGHRYELHYIRDKEGREVDFAVIKEGVLVELIEVKYQGSNLSKSLNYYAEHLNPVQGATQVLSTKKTFSGKGKIKVQSVFEMFNPATLGA